MDYIVVRRLSMHLESVFQQLEHAVSAYTNEGYVPSGGISITVHARSEANTVYIVAQSMTRSRAPARMGTTPGLVYPRLPNLNGMLG